MAEKAGKETFMFHGERITARRGGACARLAASVIAEVVKSQEEAEGITRAKRRRD